MGLLDNNNRAMIYLGLFCLRAHANDRAEVDLEP